jgi:energy-converting hydrogenase Eha subunit A
MPVALALPIQWVVLGWRALPVALVASLAGVIFSCLLLANWQRIPFTCSYLPGKRLLAQSFVMGLVLFVVFTTIGTRLARVAMAGAIPAVVVAAVLLTTIVVLRRHLRRSWESTPLLFDDVVPDELQLLRL